MGKRRDMCIISRYKTKINVVRKVRKTTCCNKNTKARGYTIDDKCVIISNSTGQGVVLSKKQLSPTVSFSACARKFSCYFFTVIKERCFKTAYKLLPNFILKDR